MDEIKIYSLDEVTKILKVTRRTLYNYLKAGKLKGVKMGKEWRIRHDDLDRFTKGE